LLQHHLIKEDDQMLRCLIKTFPFYLKNKVIDTNGNLSLKTAQSDQERIESPPQMMDEDHFHDIKLISQNSQIQIISIRFVLEKAVNSIQSSNLKWIYFLIVQKWILTVGFALTIILVYLHFVDHLFLIFENIYEFNKAQNILNVLSPNLLWFWISGLDNGTSFNDEEAFD
jgi:hypothetical protein